ncbi:hypothetical protein LARV_03646 [Longilinea arvoryzae]|uniref:Uncharacterized protein n=1 Tax=Longilinea arvoryzae TaxID=360412 RepID=A0A0S7BJB6_9CHLR|nr:hypothetical protein [Longilinea arvoryzae]GAP15853.1 hypothetical protein LARV_03646 [Longilinea arvoryzae]
MEAPDLSTGEIENAALRLEYMTGAGPRVLRLIDKHSNQNLFAELPQIFWETIHGAYHPFGGHRLWLSPEIPEITYIPDELAPQIEALPDGVRLTGALEAPTGMRKVMEIHLDLLRPGVTLEHRVTNQGQNTIEVAPWAITQMAPGGWAVLPNPPSRTQASPFLPDRALALWPYSRLEDARLRFQDSRILVHCDASTEPFKIGVRNPAGWLGYYRQGTYFRKSTAWAADANYPDFGCNLEVYAINRFLELETLGPLTRLAPGASLSHTETWQVWSGLDGPETPEALGERIETLF